jgi:hypothetical protein
MRGTIRISPSSPQHPATLSPNHTSGTLPIEAL